MKRYTETEIICNVILLFIHRSETELQNRKGIVADRLVQNLWNSPIIGLHGETKVVNCFTRRGAQFSPCGLTL